LFRKLLKRESGYSLIEVMASIIILSLAILPMASMFDMGLRTATTGSNYDKARTLANLKMEEAKSLPFADVENDFPVTPSTPDVTTGYDDSGFISESGPASADFTNFEYRVEKQYMAQPPTDLDDADPAGPTQDFLPCPNLVNDCTPPTNLIRITVTVGWGDYDPGTDTYSNTYTTFGLVTA